MCLLRHSVASECCFELCYSAQSCDVGVTPGSVVNGAGAADSPVLPTVGSWRLNKANGRNRNTGSMINWIVSLPVTTSGSLPSAEHSILHHFQYFHV